MAGNFTSFDASCGMGNSNPLSLQVPLERSNVEDNGRPEDSNLPKTKKEREEEPEAKWCIARGAYRKYHDASKDKVLGFKAAFVS